MNKIQMIQFTDYELRITNYALYISSTFSIPKISKQTHLELKNIFIKLDNFQFGGVTISDQEKDDLIVTLLKIVKKLEREL